MLCFWKSIIMPWSNIFHDIVIDLCYISYFCKWFLQRLSAIHLLTHCSLVMTYGNIDLGQHWLRQQAKICCLTAPSHDLKPWTNVDLSSIRKSRGYVCGIWQYKVLSLKNKQTCISEWNHLREKKITSKTWLMYQYINKSNKSITEMERSSDDCPAPLQGLQRWPWQPPWLPFHLCDRKFLVMFSGIHWGAISHWVPKPLTVLCNWFENYTFIIIATRANGQWVKKLTWFHFALCWCHYNYYDLHKSSADLCVCPLVGPLPSKLVFMKHRCVFYLCSKYCVPAQN